LNNTIKNPALAVLGLLACILAGPANAQPRPGADDLDQTPSREACPPLCGVRIEVPQNRRQEPGSAPETLEVKVGETVRFATNVRSRVIFTGQTPFIDERGNPIFQFEVDDSAETALRVADDNACTEEPGCKYIIIDSTNPGRPARDPYIIVRR